MKDGTKLPDSDGVSEYDRLFARLVVVSNIADEETINAALGEVKANPTRRISDVLVERSVITPEIKNAIEALTSRSSSVLDSKDSFEKGDPETVSFAHASGEDTAGLQSEASGSLKNSFGDYEILEKIAKGGMGAVYKARHNRLNRIVALKTILDNRLDDEEAVKRFQSEAQAAAKLDHPGIVPVFQVGQVAGQHFYSMAFVEGESLNDRVKTNGPLEPKQAAQFIKEAAEAVHYAQGKGIVHRDIKPHNVLIDSENGKARVTDFGLAKQVEADSELTATGQVMGTPSYMPPEQALGRHEQVGVASDIYSLGGTLYFLLTARPPFQAASTAETIRQVLDTEPASPRSLNPNVPKDLETICLKCLSKETQSRYGSSRVLADDLQRWLNGEPILARPVSRIEKAWKWCKRRPALVGTVAAATIVLVVATVIFNERRNDAEATRIVNGLLQADTSQIQTIIEQDLPGYRSWATNDLKKGFADSQEDSNAKLHAALAILSDDKSVLPMLKDRLLNVTPVQFEDVRDLLEDDKDELVEYYWEVAKKNETPPLRFQAACALATFDPANENWQDKEFRTFVAEHLVSVRPSELLPWTNALRPVKGRLAEPLSKIYRDLNAGEQARSFATDTLADYLADDADGLFNLLADADEEQFGPMFDKLVAHRERTVELGNAEVTKTVPKDASESKKEALAMRQANAAVMLLRMDSTDKVWPLLKHSPDPRVRSYIINWLSPRGGKAASIIARFDVERDITIKRALLLCLGHFQLSKANTEPLIEKLLGVYKTDPDSGLHSAAEWLLRKWGQGEKIAVINTQLQQNEKTPAPKDTKRQWYVNGQGQTFAIVEASTFLMGAPDSESRHDNETRHLRTINRRFAIATKEVSKSQWKEFCFGRNVLQADKASLKEIIPNDASAMTAINWYEAAHYCNWLSEQEGISERQWCYEPNDDGDYFHEMKTKENFLQFKGYRLPTEAEWEFACRAGATTSRSYGHSDSLLHEYAYAYVPENQKFTVASVTFKPNDFGMFSMLGNVAEICQDAYRRYPVDEDVTVYDRPQDSLVLETQRRVLRGGSLTTSAPYSRCASRPDIVPGERGLFGLRPARTMPR